MKRKLLRIASLITAIVIVLGAILAYKVLHQVRGQYFDSAGVKIHYTDQGQGEPVLLVHGYTANSDVNWRLPGILSRLEAQYRVITMDVRGHGLSDKPHDPSKYGIETVNDVLRLMDHLKIEKAHLVGYSMGGFITWKFLTQHPDRLISAMPCGAAWMPPGDALCDLLTNIHNSLAGTGTNSFLMGARRSVLRSVLDLEALGGVAAGFHELAIPEADMRAVRVPVLSLKGGEEEVVLGGGDIKAVFPAFEEIIIPGARHNSVIFYGAFQDAILNFLHKHPAKG